MITGKHKKEMESLKYELDYARKDIETLNASIQTLREEHDAELSAALAGKIDAEAELSRFQSGFYNEPSEPKPISGAAGKLPKKPRAKKD